MHRDLVRSKKIETENRVHVKYGRLLFFSESFIISTRHSNYADVAEWYTRQLEVLVLARDWRFKSSRPHHKKDRRMRRSFLFAID